MFKYADASKIYTSNQYVSSLSIKLNANMNLHKRETKGLEKKETEGEGR